MEQQKGIIKKIIKISNWVNFAAAIISLSIFLLSFMMSPLAASIFLRIQSFIDIYFIANFLLRVIAFRSLRWFIKGFGWLDLIAALPALRLLPFARFSLLPGSTVQNIKWILHFLTVMRTSLISRYFRSKRGQKFLYRRMTALTLIISLAALTAAAAVRTTADSIYKKHIYTAINEISKQQGSFLSGLGYYETLQPKGFSIFAWEINNQFWQKAHLKKINSAEYKRTLLKYPETIYIRLSPSRSVLIYDENHLEFKNLIFFTIFTAAAAAMLLAGVFIGLSLKRDLKILNTVIDAVDIGNYKILKSGKIFGKKNPRGSQLQNSDHALAALIKAVRQLILANEKEIAHFQHIPEHDHLDHDHLDHDHLDHDHSAEINGETNAYPKNFETELAHHRELLLSRLEEMITDSSVKAVQISAKSILAYIRQQNSESPSGEFPEEGDS